MDRRTLGALLAAGAWTAGCAPFHPGSGASAAPDPAPRPQEAGGGPSNFDGPLEVTAGEAFLRFEPAEAGPAAGPAGAPAAWTVGNRRFEERLELRPAAGGGYFLTRRSLRSREGSINAEVAEATDVSEAASPQDALGIGIEGARPALEPLSQRLERRRDGTLYGAVRLRHPASDAEVTAELRLRPGHAVVEHRVSLHHVGDQPLRLTRLDAADLV